MICNKNDSKYVGVRSLEWLVTYPVLKICIAIVAYVIHFIQDSMMHQNRTETGRLSGVKILWILELQQEAKKTKTKTSSS